MTKIKFLQIAVLSLIIINVLLIVFLYLGKPDRDNPNMAKNIIINKLQFDQAQISQYELLIQDHQKTIKSIREDIHINKKRLFASLAENEIIANDTILNNIANLEKQIEQTHFTHFLAIKKICKANQIADFNNLTEELAHFFEMNNKKKMGPKD